MTHYDFRLVSVRIEAKVATVTLNRPDALNAVNGDMHRELSEVFWLLARDPSCNVVVLTGNGRAFCSGGDFDWIQSMIDDHSKFDAILQESKAIVFSMLDIGKPMICRMNGDAVGLGASLALCCDMIVASREARFGDTHVRAGLVAGDGAAIILPAVIGMMKAKELLLTGDLIAAEEGRAMGLINHVVDAEELDAKVAKLAERFARGASLAIGYTKAAMNAKLKSDVELHMGALMAYEALSNRSADHAEAIAAIREKRRPSFVGR